MKESEFMRGGELISERKAVQRLGNVVARPIAPWTPSVHEYLVHLAQVGFDGAPRVGPEGERPQHDVVEYLEGHVDGRRIWSEEAMHDLGTLIRRLHECSSSFSPSKGEVWQETFLPNNGPDSIISHRDAAPWNVVAKEDRPVALIDWELSGPVDPIADLAYAGWLNARLFDDYVAEMESLPSIETRAALVRAFVEGYELTRKGRATFVERMIEVAILSAAGDAIEAEITPEGTGQEWLVWGVAWRTRAAAFLVQNRKLLEREM